MVRAVHGVIDPRSGKFNAVSKPNPTRTGRGSIARGNDGHLDTAISTAQGLALQSGRRTAVATKITADDGSESLVVHGTVKSPLKGANGGSGNQLARSTSNSSV